MRSHLFVPVVLLALSGCGSPTYEGKKIDVRYGIFRWDVQIGVWDDIVLWQGEDGAKFSLSYGGVDCFGGGEDREFITWHFDFADGTWADGQWFLSGQCELVGENSIRFIYDVSGDIITTSNEVAYGECLRFTKRLPGGDTWWPGVAPPDDPPIPEEVILPEVMPEVVFEKLFSGCADY